MCLPIESTTEEQDVQSRHHEVAYDTLLDGWISLIRTPKMTKEREGLLFSDAVPHVINTLTFNSIHSLAMFRSIKIELHPSFKVFATGVNISYT